MRPFGYSCFVFLNASFFAFAPVLLIVYLPNEWWGLGIKAVAIIWILSVIFSMLRQVPAQQHVYGGSAPGFVLSLPFLFLRSGWSLGY